VRSLTIAQFISLDGVVESPERWHFPYLDDEFNQAMWAGMGDVDTLLLGRVTYEIFAGTFATAPAGDPVAAQLNRPQKAVVSGSLTDPAWVNSTVLPSLDGVRALKEAPGGDIVCLGSITLSRALLAAGLVDELHLLVHPIVVGAGERLFPATGPQLPLKVAASAVLGSGVVDLHYSV
jgi:dihydrofolate reductase